MDGGPLDGSLPGPPSVVALPTFIDDCLGREASSSNVTCKELIRSCLVQCHSTSKSKGSAVHLFTEIKQNLFLSADEQVQVQVNFLFSIHTYSHR